MSNTRETFKAKVDRLKATPLPTTQKEVMTLTGELGKVADEFDAKVNDLKIALAAYESDQSILREKIGKCFISIAQEYTKTE
jgi:hypothetical protein